MACLRGAVGRFVGAILACIVLTCIMLTPTACAPPPAPAGAQWLQHVSQFDRPSPSGQVCRATALHNARLDALARVASPMCAFVDVGDQLLHVPTAVPTGLLHGIEHIYSVPSQSLTVVPATPWTAARHATCAHLIHRAVCCTQTAQAVAQLLPRGLFYTEWLLYYFVAAWRGAQLTPAPLYRWQRQATGMHLQVNQAVGASALWLLQNQARVLATLRANHTTP